MEFSKRTVNPCLCFSCKKCTGYERAKLGVCQDIIANVNFKCSKFGTVDTLVVRCPKYEKDDIKSCVIAKQNGKRTIVRGKQYNNLIDTLNE